MQRWPMQLTKRTATVLVAATLIIGGCGDDDGPSGNAGDIAVTVTPAALSVEQGSGGTVAIALVRGGGFTGDVSLSVTGLPAGVTTTLTPALLTGNTFAAEVDVDIAETVAPGNYTATIHAMTLGGGARTASYALTVTGKPPAFSLALEPATLTVAQGASGSATAIITRVNFTGDVALTLDAAPPTGITAAFTPASASSDFAMVAVSVDEAVAPGTYPLTIQGNGTLGTRSAALELTVTAPGSGVNADWQFCSATAVPLFFAYQDGAAGAWKAVAPTVAGSVTKYRFTLSQSVGGVMFVNANGNMPAIASSRVVRGLRLPDAVGTAARQLQPPTRVDAPRSTAPSQSSAGSFSTAVTYATAAELTTLGTDNCLATQPSKSVTGVVAGIAGGEVALMSLGGSPASFSAGTASANVTFTGVPSGVVDFAASRSSSATGVPDMMIVFRNLNIPDGGALPSTIDFNGASAVAPASAEFTIHAPDGSGSAWMSTDLLTANSTSLELASHNLGGGATNLWYGLAPEQMVAGDIHSIAVGAVDSDFIANAYFTATRFVGAVTDVSLTLGPKLVHPTSTLLEDGGYPRFRWQGALPAEYRNMVSLAFLGRGASFNGFEIVATGGYLTALGSDETFDLTMPDVAGFVGFPIASRLTAGFHEITMSAAGWTGAGIVTAKPQVGGEMKSSVLWTTIQVP